ncbi:hypothetical protein FF1_008377 [Malus domestica]
MCTCNGSIGITSSPRILTIIFFCPKNATPASELDGEASGTPMDTDSIVATGNMSQGGSPIPNEHQKQSSDTDVGQEGGQLEADAEVEVEAGMLDGEDAEADLNPVG